ncbi:MAG: hypothetical protein BWY04_01171 [candidate division CPR1 bacterium ADurb.Bin160]|uniref:Uncharacterized protein n=1 Tax=candidate division CPR1 bacterium ADurb.Bin160 TaxID=1852826 RepID=A0A1V5ZLC1_9BACT|nr:MAG: hypothetical protein BWY04_01171 [candidate division CPR1 bacterium ADurb.Bin160]
MLRNINYLEAVYKENFNFFPDTIKKIFYKVVGLVKIKNYEAEDYLQEQYNKAKELFPNIDFDEIANRVILNNKQDVVDIVNKSSYSEGFLQNQINKFKAPSQVDRKELFNKVKKGFIPSATFYPTLKLFEQFFKVIEGQINLSQIQLHLSSTEMLTIMSAVFIYLFTKTIKDANELLENKIAKEKSEINNKEKTYKRINKVLDSRLWSQEQMDEWLQQKLWSPEQLDALISEKITNALHEDFQYYTERGFAENINRRLETFYIQLINVKEKSANFALEVVVNILLKMSDEEINLYFKNLPQTNPSINEEVEYNEAIIKSFKELASETFSSLGFFSAFKVWDVVDKIGAHGFNNISMIDKRNLSLYTAIFLGVVGYKIGSNRIREYLELKKEKKQLEIVNKPKEIVNNVDEW